MGWQVMVVFGGYNDNPYRSWRSAFKRLGEGWA
jgi:hypothetical protein